jgi:hypothetical protein
MPQLQVDGETKTDIRNAVNAGKEATVQQSDITFNGWTGHGYIVIDPETGAGAYMIAGGMSGAMLIVGTLFLFVSMMFLAILAVAPETFSWILPLFFANVFASIYFLYGEDTFIEFAECFDSSLVEIVNNIAFDKYESYIIYELIQKIANRLAAQIISVALVVPKIKKFGYCIGYVLWGNFLI